MAAGLAGLNLAITEDQLQGHWHPGPYLPAERDSECALRRQPPRPAGLGPATRT